MDAFCQEELGLGTWDSLMVPGGIYLISYPGALPQSYRVGSRMLEFLIAQHAPRRVVLVSHQGCARYREGLSLKPGRTLEEKQKDDLMKVAVWLRDRYPALEVSAYYAAGDAASGGSFEAVHG